MDVSGFKPWPASALSIVLWLLITLGFNRLFRRLQQMIQGVLSNIIGGPAAAATEAAATSAVSAMSSSASSSSSASATSQSSSSASQDSRARGNTQTQPTTSTRTRYRKTMNWFLWPQVSLSFLVSDSNLGLLGPEASNFVKYCVPPKVTFLLSNGAVSSLGGITGPGC